MNLEACSLQGLNISSVLSADSTTLSAQHPPYCMFAQARSQIPPDEVPRGLSTTAAAMQQRRFFAQTKWQCVPRPQYSSSCGMSSVTAVWNSLFSTLGDGTLPPISVEEVGEALGFHPPLRDHGLFYVQTNTTILKWFHDLCHIKGKDGSGKILLKLKGSRKTDIDPLDAFWEIVSAIHDPHAAVIYHCEGHYMTVVGYELSPTLQTDAYSAPSDIAECDVEPWLIAADANGRKAPLHSIRWTDVLLDLSLLYPSYFDVRRPELGVREHKSRLYTEGEYAGRNLHCLMLFTSSRC